MGATPIRRGMGWTLQMRAGAVNDQEYAWT